MGKKRQLSFEEKLNLVLACIREEIGVREAARIAQTAHSSVRNWINRYEAEGAEGLLLRTGNRVYPAELKMEAVLAYLRLTEIYKKWANRPATNWAMVRNQLSMDTKMHARIMVYEKY